MRHALLPGDAAHEKHVGHCWIDAILGQRRGLAGLLVLGQIDAVVDDMNARRVDVGVRTLNIDLRALRDSDDRVGVENRGPLHPRAHRVAAAELLCLPCAQRLQRMGGQDKGNAVEFLRQVAGHRHIPGMRVHDVDSFEGLDLRQVQAEGLKSAFELSFGAIGNLLPWLGSAHVKVAVVRVLRSPAMHLDFDLASPVPGSGNRRVRPRPRKPVEDTLA